MGGGANQYLAGFADSAGRLPKLVQSRLLFPDDIRLNADADRLLWSRPRCLEQLLLEDWGYGGSAETPERDGELDTEVLPSFLNLSNHPEDILRFARSYGPFGFVELSALKQSEEPRSCLNFLFEGKKWKPDEVRCKDADPAWEPVGLWPIVRDRAKAILQIAAQMRLGRTGDVADWRVGVPFFCVEPWPISFEKARFGLWFELMLWLHEASIHPFFGPRSGAEWQQELVCGLHYPLFGAITLQINAAVIGGALHNCSGCGFWYRRSKRRLKRGERNFCDSCGVRESKRQARERYRAKRSA